MGLIKAFTKKFRAYINTRDEHYPAHIHLVYGDYDIHARMYISNCEIEYISKKQLTANQVKQAKRYVTKNSNALQKEFDRMMSGKAPRKID